MDEKKALISMYTYAQEYLTHRIKTVSLQQYKDEYERELDEIQELYVKLLIQFEK